MVSWGWVGREGGREGGGDVTLTMSAKDMLAQTEDGSLEMFALNPRASLWVGVVQLSPTEFEGSMPDVG